VIAEIARALFFQSHALTLAVNGTVAFAAAWWNARRAGHWLAAAGFLVGSFAAALYEIALLFGVLSLRSPFSSEFVWRMNVTVIFVMLCGSMAGVIASIWALATAARRARSYDRF